MVGMHYLFNEFSFLLGAECLDLWAKILNWVIQVQAIVGKNVGISDDPLQTTVTV